MADVNKTIDIQIKADLKDMLRQLKTMPNMAGDEAKKMVNQLKRQFQRAEIAAKKQAKAYAASNRQMADTTKQASNSMVKSYDRIEKKQKSARVQSRELGASLGSLEDVVSVVSPELGGLAMTVGTLGQGFRTLSRAMMTGNPVIMTLIGLTAAAAVAYHSFTSATREAARKQKLMADATEKNNEKLAEQADIIRDVTSSMGKTQRELLVQTGQMTELEASIAEAKEDSANATNKDLLVQRKYIVETQQLLKLSKTMRSNHHALTQEEKDRLEAAMMLSGERRFQHGFAKNETALYGQLGQFQDHLNKKIDEQRRLANGIRDARNKELETRIEILKNEDELQGMQQETDRAEALAAERRAAADKSRIEREKKAAEERAESARREAEAAKILNEIRKTGDKAREEAQKSAVKNERDRIGLLENEVQRVEQTAELESRLSKERIAAYEAQKNQNLELVQNAEQYYEAQLANEELDKRIAAEKEAAHIQDMKFSQERLEALEKERKQRMNMIASIVQGGASAAEGIATIIGNVTGENHKAAVAAFRVQQAASIANIAMLTAEKIMAVAPNPIAMGAVGALGLIQAGAVMSQSPPEKHMGGMITKGEDTRNVTVLTGEAVLDRMTVQRLGGEQGINRLQRGMTQQPNVLLMNPFKHFDRYASASLRRGGSIASIANRKASGSY